MQATLVGELECVSEKVARRKGSFTKAVLASPPKLRDASSGGISKEHSEQGRVKMEVYSQYLHAASKKGFLFFVLATVLQQAVSVASTVMLRLWGENNREAGNNVGLADKYFLGYGFFNLASIMLGACAALLIWVFCSLRSSKHLHDSVSLVIPIVEGSDFIVFVDAEFGHACTSKLLRDNARRTVRYIYISWNNFWELKQIRVLVF
jgi:ATP-binding cassette subfamily C (CFTR/MRP) protein 1